MSDEKYQSFTQSDGRSVVIDLQSGFSYYTNNSQQTNAQQQPKYFDKHEQKEALKLSISSFSFENVICNNSCKFVYKPTIFKNREKCSKLEITIEKSQLVEENLRVIGQVDRKFVICLLIKQNLLIAFDQHAVHERIRLEELIQDSTEPNGKLKMITLVPPVVLTHDCEDFREALLKNIFKINKDYGIDIKKSPSDTNKYLIRSLPKCLNSFKFEQMTVINLLKDIISSITNGDSSSFNLNKLNAITDSLASQACHGAIRFGDVLSLNDCKKLLQSLTSCKLLFQCAHGRPSLAPLIYLPNKL